MLCDNCGKKEANVKYSENINGVKREFNLCEECSRKLGIGEINFKMPIDFSSFFGDLLSEYDNAFMPLLQEPHELKCDKCNMTYSEFMELGKFGCENCYNAFSGRIDPVLKRIQGSNRYTGRKAEMNEENEKEVKTNNKAQEPKGDKLTKLKAELKQLVKEEKYEEAAKIRDEIKKLEVQE